jgi:hypothetical protein
MARPEGTYVSKVFNFGVDKNIPFGFVDVVFDKTGNAVGFEKDGVFYNLGEKVQVVKQEKPLTSKQLSLSVDLLTRKLNDLKLRASNTNIGDAERNRYIEQYKSTQEELNKAKESLVETQVSEGKLKEAEANKKAADVIRFDIRALQERRKLVVKMGQAATDIDKEIANKQRSLNSIVNPVKTKTAPGPVVPTQNLPFGGKSVTGEVIPPSGSVTQTTATTLKTPAKTPAKPSTPAAVSGDDDTKTPEQRYSDAIALAVEKYNMPDIIFRNVGSLKTLLNRFVNDELTEAQFKREIELDPWYRSNSAEIKARYVQLFNYEDLVKQGRATGTTDYEQKINSIIRRVQAKARELNGAEIPDDQAKLIAKDLYIYNLDSDPAILTERLVGFIRPSAGMIGGVPTIGYGGQALQNYQALQAVAKANGMRIEDLLPRDATGKTMTAEGTLEQLALGKLDLNRIAQDARKLAALGQPDYVKDLLGQGYDLEAIYAPYKNIMANILEIDPNTVSLSDSALRMGISKEGDMNLYDYERALRNDSRWQYTQKAREEVSDVALRVLRDFGFQG